MNNRKHFFTAIAIYAAITLVLVASLSNTLTVQAAKTQPVPVFVSDSGSQFYDTEAYHCGFRDAMVYMVRSQAFAVRKDPDRRYENGVTVAKYYHEDGDYTSMGIETDDGNTWIVDEFVAVLYTQCVVEFDTHGTDDVSDDTITAVYTRNEWK